MLKLVMRADDLGYSEAVNYGIEKSVKEGFIGSVGLMPNMPAAKHGLSLLKGTGVCLGQHTNVCLGKPCANPDSITSLLDENGNLKSSKTYREAYAKGEDFVVFEEAFLEIEAQYMKFRELTGKDPDYFEAHAVTSVNLYKALEAVAGKYGLRYNDMSPVKAEGKFDGISAAACKMESMSPDYDPWQCLKRAVENARKDMPNIFVCHPGYLDDYVLTSSSLTVNRTKEVAMLCDSKMRQWLAEQGVELVTYNDIR